MFGFQGKILRLNLSDRKVSHIDTKEYLAWGGGHGMGTAIFFDLVKDKAIGGLDPDNVITIMTSPLSGTLAPTASGRTEMQAIGVQSYPAEWFTRSNFGGRFSGMLKFAGYDGVVIEGKSQDPVWVDIRNHEVKFRDARPLWGMDTWQTQQKIWQEVSGLGASDDWWEMAQGQVKGRTTARPAVLAIGPAGEKQNRMAAVIHDAGSAAGQGGFGAVWGSKNLKALSVIGTHSIKVADPDALMETRLWAQQRYGYHYNNPTSKVGVYAFGGKPASGSAPAKGEQSRPWGCLACHKLCRRKTASGGNESTCVDFFWYSFEDEKKHGKRTDASFKAADLVQKTGINAYELEATVIYLRDLYKQGLIGRGKEIESDLPFDKFGEWEFAAELVRQIESQEGIGVQLSQGLARAAKEWGRLDKDLKSGLLPLQYWGYPQHYDARVLVEWGYGSILGDRDCNEHDFLFPCYYNPSIAALVGVKPFLSAEGLAEIMAEKLSPYNDPMMIDYSDDGIYSEAMAKTVAWHRRYTRFWKQSIGFCDWAFADFVNPYAEDNKGLSPDAEVRFFKAVTGQDLSFEASMDIGRRIWTLDRAIWVLQGRHRDQEVLSDYTYDQPVEKGHIGYEIPHVLTVHENGKWAYKRIRGRKLDRTRFEDWKTKYYKLEGWDAKTGWPTRQTLLSQGLGKAADELAAKSKLGAS